MGQVSRTALWPLPHSRWEVVDREVRDMLKLGIIKPSNSSLRSLIVLVPKPDGLVWFCIDFREVNKLAKFDTYLMPRTDILLSKLGNTLYMSALDMTEGYWQVPTREQDKQNTAFATPRDLFQFMVVPFGLHGSAATFQRLMDTILRPWLSLMISSSSVRPGAST